MFNFFKSNKPDSNSQNIFNISNEQIAVFDYNRNLSEKGKYEVLLFCAYCILNTKDLSQEIKSKYLRYLVDIRVNYGITNSSGSIVDLINSRMPFYASEFEKIFKTNNYLNGRIFNIFYENPLLAIPIQSSNLPEIIKFMPRFNLVFQKLTQT